MASLSLSLNVLIPQVLNYFVYKHIRELTFLQFLHIDNDQFIWGCHSGVHNGKFWSFWHRLIVLTNLFEWRKPFAVDFLTFQVGGGFLFHLQISSRSHSTASLWQHAGAHQIKLADRGNMPYLYSRCVTWYHILITITLRGRMTQMWFNKQGHLWLKKCWPICAKPLSN